MPCGNLLYSYHFIIKVFIIVKTEVITAQSRTTFSDVVRARYLIQQFAKRDFTVRYTNSYLGYIWAIANPLCQSLIYIIVFGVLAKVQTPDYPTAYSVVLLLGLLVWTLFNQAAEQCSNVLIGNMHLLKKVYFPRINLCIAAIATSVIDFFLAFGVALVLLLLLGFSNIAISLKFLLLPVVLIGVILLALSVGSVAAILKIKYQDFKHIMPIFFQVLFFMSPVVYSQTLVPQEFLVYYKLNPLYGYISTFRWMFINGAPVEIGYLIYSIIFSTILFIMAMYYFSKQERQIVDSE